MTLVQASIANDGNCVILVADRLLTRSFGDNFPSYEFEWNSPKIFSKGNVGIGFAGAAIYADIAKNLLQNDNDLKDFLLNNGVIPNSNVEINFNDLNEIVRLLTLLVKQIKVGTIEGTIQKMAGVSSQDFFSNPNLPVPDQVRDFIYGWHSEFNLDFECIVTGFDNNSKPQIVVIDYNGNATNITNFGSISIGSGSVFSQIYFDQMSYDISLPENDGLFFAYKAKKWAQAPTGVGLKTDIILIRKSDPNLDIHDDDPLMTELNKIYSEHEGKIYKSEKSLLRRLVKNSKGSLK